MFLEHSRWRKLAKFVSYHVFRHKDGVKNLAIMHQEGVADKVRGDGAAAGPSLDWPFRTSIIQLVDFLEQVLLDEWSFFEGASHTSECLLGFLL